MAVDRDVASAAVSILPGHPYTIESQTKGVGMDNPSSAGMLSVSLVLGPCIGDIHDRLLASRSGRTIAEELSENFVREKPRCTKTRILGRCTGLTRSCSNARPSEETVHKRSGSPIWITRNPLLSFKAVRAAQCRISYVLSCMA